MTLVEFHTDKSRIVLNNDGAVQDGFIWTLIHVCFVDQQRVGPLIS